MVWAAEGRGAELLRLQRRQLRALLRQALLLQVPLPLLLVLQQLPILLLLLLLSLLLFLPLLLLLQVQLQLLHRLAALRGCAAVAGPEPAARKGQHRQRLKRACLLTHRQCKVAQRLLRRRLCCVLHTPVERSSLDYRAESLATLEGYGGTNLWHGGRVCRQHARLEHASDWDPAVFRAIGVKTQITIALVEG